MPKIWRNRIIAGDKLFSDCPERYRDNVRELLKYDVADGTITAEQYEEYTGEKYVGVDK